jgi:hypothetical protein
MWRTQDGFTLTIPRSTLEAFASEAEAEAELEGGCPACVRAGVLNELEKMARKARRSGSVRSKRSGKKYGTFSGKSGGRSFKMVTKPTGPRQSAIMGVRPWPWGPGSGGWGPGWGWGPGSGPDWPPGCADDDDCADRGDADDSDDADDMLESFGG